MLHPVLYLALTAVRCTYCTSSHLHAAHCCSAASSSSPWFATLGLPRAIRCPTNLNSKKKGLQNHLLYNLGKRLWGRLIPRSPDKALGPLHHESITPFPPVRIPTTCELSHAPVSHAAEKRRPRGLSRKRVPPVELVCVRCLNPGPWLACFFLLAPEIRPITSATTVSIELCDPLARPRYAGRGWASASDSLRLAL